MLSKVYPPLRNLLDQWGGALKPSAILALRKNHDLDLVGTARRFALHLRGVRVSGWLADWDRAYRPEFTASITPRLHIIMNALLILAGLQVGLLHRDEQVRVGAVPPAHALAWLTLATLLLSNAMFHLKGSLHTKRYSPGLITGLGLYVPLAIFGYGYFVGTHKASLPIAFLALAIGGSYHFWAAMMHRRRAERRAARANSR